MNLSTSNQQISCSLNKPLSVKLKFNYVCSILLYLLHESDQGLSIKFPACMVTDVDNNIVPYNWHGLLMTTISYV